MPLHSERQWLVRQDDLTEVAKYVATRLSEHEIFVLWLRGELGAGKTTFAGVLLRALGLSKTVPVLSPTFTFMMEYQTNIGLVAHLDLYRIKEGDSDTIDFLLSDRNFTGMIIEWPERAANSPAIKKTHELNIAFVENHDERALVFREEI